MLPKYSLSGKPEANRRLLRWGIEIIALPLEPAVAQVLEHRPREQINCFCGGGSALKKRGEDDESDFDDTVSPVDAEEAEEADCLVGGLADDSVEKRVFGVGVGGDYFCEGGLVGEWALVDVCPESGVFGLSDDGVQVVDVAGVQWFQVDRTATDCG